MTDAIQHRLEPQEWMAAPATRRVLAALEAQGQRVRFVGGCVRDALLGLPVNDVDIATPDPPERVIALLEEARLKVVPTGVDHGTVTAVAAGQPFEITTLRRDEETFGRHARVAFTDDWKADAARRDFTMNALSCDAAGRIWDYFGGVADARAGRVRFVGSARQRIAEDYLRLLRFFRFLARYGRGEPDGEALAAAVEAAPELARLSGERVRDELLKLLAAPEPVPTLSLMHQHRILASELPEAGPPDRLSCLLTLDHAADTLLRLAALLDCDEQGAATVVQRLRLSNAQRDRLILLRTRPRPVRPDMEPRALRRTLYRFGVDAVRELLLLATAEEGWGAEALDSARKQVDAWLPRSFPLKGRDLLAVGADRGPELGRLLHDLEAWWIEGDFSADHAALLTEAQRRLRSGDPS
ncbi:CCA tRNA nucleotidyltransferase [Aquibaculum sediminis]|uniref:CCA tRNA nucleotidyltransferase n=1 Tax=Aquibaculum sediminis TaxID=3231907 RepID=UPI003454E0AC